MESSPANKGKRKASPKEKSRKATAPPSLESKERDALIPDQMYGNPVTLGYVRNVCAGCLGRKNQQLKDDPILFCDGKDCGREFHLQCCLPPLTSAEIPECSYLCIDCDKDGTSSLLEQYFEEIWENRAKFSTSREHVESLFDKDQLIPVSEIPRMTYTHREALRGVRHMQGNPVPHELGPDFLIGRPVRLYSHIGNAYHDGRIIDWRRATHLRPISSSLLSNKDDFMFGEISEVARCEFLVAFPAGLNYRKRTVHEWLILEEHSLAVGTSLVWGQDSIRKEWLPGLLWLRSSLELIPVISKMDEEGQVLYNVNDIGRTTAWALCQVFGRENHLLLNLKEEAVDLFSPFFSERFSKTVETGDGPRVDLHCMLAFTEVDEQRQLRRWLRLPLKNAKHEMALNIADKYMLPPLYIKSEEAANDQSVKLAPRPCPQIRSGLDRQWILKQLQSQGVEQSKDTAADITVHVVTSRSAAIGKLQEQEKSRQNRPSI
jgi:hypothetical protein